MPHPELHWLPETEDRAQRLRAARTLAPREGWIALTDLARTRLDFVATDRLDRALSATCAGVSPAEFGATESRLALLSSATGKHLIPSLRIAALRRGIWLHVYVSEYGQYRQELLDPDSGLRGFKPDTILFALDARHLLGSVFANDRLCTPQLVEDCIGHVNGQWSIAKEQFAAHVIQQEVLNTWLPLAGGNEHRLAGSPRRLIEVFNQKLQPEADKAGVDLLRVDVTGDGILAWHDPRLWDHGKFEITPVAAPVWGDLAMRLIGARMGLSAKCVVLDLDNTLWGGVVGDDGVEGIELGQGSARGEAFVNFQSYLRGLSQRGVILGVCSKNDEANALAPFERHPEMVLKQADIACFVANWDDKPANIRRVAQELGIGIDSLVFVDDNPFERAIVRRELPQVAVLELPDDPSLFARCLADAGYFESVQITEDDLRRARQYLANRQREIARESTTDLAGFLASLEMELLWSNFDELNKARVTQLVNKTNQFNLTTRRYTEMQIEQLIGDPAAITMHCRLLDRFGDNGVIGAIVAKPRGEEGDMCIETWLMSCRVLGRNVEAAMLNLLVGLAAARGARRLVGEYRPTPKNGMVRDHYAKLGFAQLDESPDGSLWAMALKSYEPFIVPIATRRV